MYAGQPDTVGQHVNMQVPTVNYTGEVQDKSACQRPPQMGHGLQMAVKLSLNRQIRTVLGRLRRLDQIVGEAGSGYPNGTAHTGTLILHRGQPEGEHDPRSGLAQSTKSACK